MPRHPLIVTAGHHYGVTIATCVVADPETKGGSESTVRIAKADLVPTDANLGDDYDTWAELAAACELFMGKVNERAHRITRRLPVEMLAEERARLHRLPATAFTAAFGETRKVSWSSTISLGGVTYSVPHQLADQQVWVRVDGDEIVATHLSSKGAVEVARHQRSTPGTPRIDDSHYPPRPAGPLHRQPKAGNPAEVEFLTLGEGARLWLIEAAAAGTVRVKVKMADAVTLSRLHGVERVDWALGHAATFQRFGETDLASILAAHPTGRTTACWRAALDAAFDESVGRLRRCQAMTTSTSPIDEVVELLKALRLPHMRRHAPDMLATAKAQRWEPGEAMRALLAEELAGRSASSTPRSRTHVR